jgi:hypothetical protein
MADEVQAIYLIDREGGCVQLRDRAFIADFIAAGFWEVDQQEYERTRAAQYPPESGAISCVPVN